MTPEQLDEIEKLAEAATPGPWNHSFEFIHPQDGGISDAFIVCRHTEGGYDAAFLCEMREHALPLVKALREARALLQSVALVCRGAKEPDQADLSVLGNVLRERDEARAEVERLRAAITRFVDQYPWQQGPEIQELKALKEGDR